MAWATPAFNPDAEIMITSVSITGSIRAMYQINGVVYYLVRYDDSQGNPQQQAFKESDLSSKL